MPARQQDGRARVIIENVTPQVDDGEFPIKRIVGDTVTVEADVFTDGHDAISCALLYKKEGDSEWTEVPMEPLVNDRWQGSFKVQKVGRYLYTVSAWVDRFKTWSRALAKRVEADQDVTVELVIGAEMIAAAAKHASSKEAGWHALYAESVRAGGPDGIARAASAELAGLMRRHAERLFACTFEQEFGVVVDRERARFGAWYELFPRSASPVPGRHGTFKDLEAACRMWPPWVLTCSTCRRSTRSAAASARDPTTRRPPAQMIRAAPGLLERRRAGTKPFTRSWARSTTFGICLGLRRRCGLELALDHRFPVRAGSSLCHRASGVVPQAPRWHNPVRREPAQEVSGHLSL